MKKHKHKMRMTRSERLFRSLLILTITCASLWGVWNILVSKPAIANNTPPGKTLSINKDDVAAVADAVNSSAQEEEPEEDSLYARRDNCWTFLLIGMDKGGGNTDSLMLATYDVDKQAVGVASIARDTRVDVDRKLKKINAAYALNGGVPGVMEEVSRTFGVPIDFYLRVNLRGFIRLVDAVGGVDFYVPCSMNYDDPEQGLSIHYSKGMCHLSGQQAMEVCRFRQNNDGSGYGDGGRQETQRGVLTAVVRKALANPGKLNEYAAIASENLDTNLTASNIAWFATKAVSFDMENLHAVSMPCSWHSPYMYLDPAATLEVVNEYLNPYVLPRTADQLDIITR